MTNKVRRKVPVRLRSANQEDVGFIFNSWLKSFKYSTFASNITNTVYYTNHHKIIEEQLKTKQTIIACNDSDPSQIYGFINAGSIDGVLCVNYIYVKQPFRNLGIGKTLLNAYNHDPSVAACYTHETRSSERLAAKYNMVYHPYLLYNLPESEQNDDNQES